MGYQRSTNGIYLALLNSGVELDLARQMINDTVIQGYRDALHERVDPEEKWDLTDFAMFPLLFAYRKYGEAFTDPSIWENMRGLFCDWFYHEGDLSENHNLLHASAEFLAAEFWPDEGRLFASPLAERKLKAKTRILRWVDTYARTGSSEWFSESYMPVNLLAAYGLAELAEDAEIRAAGAAIREIIFLEAIAQEWGGWLCATTGRGYARARVRRDLGQAWPNFFYLLFGIGEPTDEIPGSVLLQIESGWKPPAAMIELARRNAKAEGILRTRHLFERGENSFYQSGYGFRCPEYYLSAMQIPGGSQGKTEQIWQATLGDNAVIFSNHPSIRRQDTLEAWRARETRSKSRHPAMDEVGRPGHFQGNESQPRCGQHEDVVFMMYHARKAKDLADFIHVYLPSIEFDEVILHGAWLCARKGEAYAAIWTATPLIEKTDGAWAKMEWVSAGGTNALICQMGRAKQDGDFERFVASASAVTPVFDADEVTLKFTSLRGRKIEMTWAGWPHVDGTLLDPSDYPRLEAPGIYSTYGSGQFEITGK